MKVRAEMAGNAVIEELIRYRFGELKMLHKTAQNRHKQGIVVEPYPFLPPVFIDVFSLTLEFR